MVSYIVRRLLMSLLTILGVTILVFLMIHLVPGDPVTVMLSEHQTQADADALRHELGLDLPLPEQYLRYISRVVQGDLGRSYRLRSPVMELIMERLPATLKLSLLSLFLAALMGIFLGVLAAVYRETPIDYISMVTALLGVSVPSFWLGLMLIMIFSVQLRWFPISGAGQGLNTIILPAITLATGALAVVTRITRSSMLDVLNADYIRTARAKGLKERTVILGHALRNSLLPVVTLLGLEFGFLLGGAIIVEKVFNWPGIGRLAIDAITARDFPLVQGISLVVAVGFVLINLLVDILYTFIDPRIKYD